MIFRRNPIISVDRTKRSNSISVATEFKHGVNDFLLKNVRDIVPEDSIAKKLTIKKIHQDTICPFTQVQANGF